MKTQTMRKLTVIFPIVSVLVSSGIVAHQYARCSRLTHALKQAESQLALSASNHEDTVKPPDAYLMRTNTTPAKSAGNPASAMTLSLASPGAHKQTHKQ